MLYYFKKDKKNATEMQKKKKAACREGAVTDQMSQKWFVKLRAGDFSQDMLKPSAENHLYQCGMLIILMFGFHISWAEKNPDWISDALLYLHIRKILHF